MGISKIQFSYLYWFSKIRETFPLFGVSRLKGDFVFDGIKITSIHTFNISYLFSDVMNSVEPDWQQAYTQLNLIYFTNINRGGKPLFI